VKLITFSDIASSRAVRSSAEAVGLVLAAMREREGASDGDHGIRLPDAEHIRLSSDGFVSFGDSPEAANLDPVNSAAILLRRFLSLDDGAPGDVPGALLLWIARASGQIDLPVPSYEVFRDALIRVGSSEAPVLSAVYRRAVNATSPGDASSPAADHFEDSPLPTAPASWAGEAFERRTGWASASDSPDEARESEFEPFIVPTPRRPAPSGRVTIAGAALAASIAAAVAAVMFPLTSSRESTNSTAARRDWVTVQTVEQRVPVDIQPPATVRANASEPRLNEPLPASRPLLSSAVLGGDVFSPSFGPDGRVLLFHAGRDRSALMRATFDHPGSPAVTTVLRDGSANYHATTSPDGAWLAYDSDRDGVRAVYVARADASAPRKITGDGYAAVPRWSPDGTCLAFIKAEPARSSVWNVWVANLGTGTISRVSGHKVGQAWGASWFPDGRRLAYSVEDSLVIANLDGGTARVFKAPRRGHLIRTPAVSPDGTRILFQVHRDGAWLLEVATGRMRRVLSDAAAEEFAWSPDGRVVVFHTRRHGGWSVWQLQMDPATGA
jgi:Tol biopolymer transport system component